MTEYVQLNKDEKALILGALLLLVESAKETIPYKDPSANQTQILSLALLLKLGPDKLKETMIKLDPSLEASFQ